MDKDLGVTLRKNFGSGFPLYLLFISLKKRDKQKDAATIPHAHKLIALKFDNNQKVFHVIERQLLLKILIDYYAYHLKII